MGVGEMDMTIQVLMVGGRRCGKTSVLAAMKANFEKVFADTRFTVTYGDNDTLHILENKYCELQDYFSEGKARSFVPDSNPTESITTYEFQIAIKGKKNKFRIRFVDYPGEWLTTDATKEHRDKLNEYMKKSQVIIIAIDTPHMIEEGGRFNEHKNASHRAGEMLKMAFEENKSSSRLILFVPLKCERYKWDDKMDKVCSQTEGAYAELINYFIRYSSTYEVAVTPIFTLGEAGFSHFEREKETGEVIIDAKWNTPQKALYYFKSTDVKKPKPEYCEQPIVYLLAYVMEMLRKEREYKYMRGNIFDNFWMRVDEMFFKQAKVDDYDSCKKEVLDRLKKEGDGYRILQDPLKFSKR